jgi:hypothetical protein
VPTLVFRFIAPWDGICGSDSVRGRARLPGSEVAEVEQGLCAALAGARFGLAVDDDSPAGAGIDIASVPVAAEGDFVLEAVRAEEIQWVQFRRAHRRALG